MKILVVVAHKASGRGELLTKRYVKHIREAFAACEHFHEKLDIQVRNHSQLSEFIPPAARETDVPDIVKVRDRLTAFDGIDFVFIDGDDNLLPWSRPAAPLLQLLHLCMSSGKIVFGSGCAVALLAYLASVGPVSVPVLNGGGKGGTLRSFGSEGLAMFGGGDSSGGNGRAGAGAGSSSTASLNASDGPMSQPGGMLLEKQTGDLFRFDDVRRAWMPVGNVGVHCSLGAISGRPDAQVGTGLNRSDGIGPCELTQAARDVRKVVQHADAAHEMEAGRDVRGVRGPAAGGQRSNVADDVRDARQLARQAARCLHSRVVVGQIADW